MSTTVILILVFVVILTNIIYGLYGYFETCVSIGDYVFPTVVGVLIAFILMAFADFIRLLFTNDYSFSISITEPGD